MRDDFTFRLLSTKLSRFCFIWLIRQSHTTILACWESESMSESVFSCKITMNDNLNEPFCPLFVLLTRLYMIERLSYDVMYIRVRQSSLAPEKPFGMFGRN